MLLIYCWYVKIATQLVVILALPLDIVEIPRDPSTQLFVLSVSNQFEQ